MKTGRISQGKHLLAWFNEKLSGLKDNSFYVKKSLTDWHLFSSTEGQLYKALLVWADHWIRAGRYPSLQEAIQEFIPKIEFEHMGVREFLSYVVPSNTLDNDQFKARCIDVMQGSVRRTQLVPPQAQQSLVTVPPPGLQHQLSVKFRADTFLSVGCDVSTTTCPEICMSGVIIRIGVRPSSHGTSPHHQNVELIISTHGIRLMLNILVYIMIHDP